MMKTLVWNLLREIEKTTKQIQSVKIEDFPLANDYFHYADDVDFIQFHFENIFPLEMGVNFTKKRTDKKKT